MKKFIALICFIFLSISAFAMDTPENLNFVWARAAIQATPVYLEPSVTSKVIKTLKQLDIIILVDEKNIDGETWYEIAFHERQPLVAWIPQKYTWFSPVHGNGFLPKTHLLYDRLKRRIEMNIGNYPKASKKFLGPNVNAYFQADRGVTTQTLYWDGLTVVYKNSYKHEDGAWITYADVTPGRVGKNIDFGPIHLGSSADDVRALQDSFGKTAEKQEDYLEEIKTATGYILKIYNAPHVKNTYCINFYIDQDDKVNRMELRWAY